MSNQNKVNTPEQDALNAQIQARLRQPIGRYRVQSDIDGDWTDCVREDLLDIQEFAVDDPAQLPPAVFATLDEAKGFIAIARGLMHMGGDGVKLRVLDDADEQEVVFTDPPELPKPPSDPTDKYAPRIKFMAALIKRVEADQPHLSPLEALGVAALVMLDWNLTNLTDSLPGAGKGY